jgi:hypothetical protein
MERIVETCLAATHQGVPSRLLLLDARVLSGPPDFADAIGLGHGAS